MSWSDERIELLQRLWEKGLSASQIAEELGEGVTRNAVIGKAHRLGLKARPSPVKAEAPKKAAPPAPKKPKPVVKPERVTLLELSDKVCKWPHGHPGEEDFHFCGKPVQPGFPYCPEHCAVAYQAQLPRRDRRPMPPMLGGRR
ncbi:GcrA family cell cycle regulator [Parapedomonas caeni]